MATKFQDILLRDANKLKEKLAKSESPLTNNEMWVHHHEIQASYSHLLLMFQDFALENQVERDLWNFGFKNTINKLQAEAHEKRKSTPEIRDAYVWFLNAATGFYIQLFNQICTKNSLEFPFRKKDSAFGLMGGGLSTDTDLKTTEQEGQSQTRKNALFLSQYCLIHLGDLARYKHQAKQAQNFYRHAVTVAPSSGHPYNQLALLEAGRGNKLAAVHLYIKALCVPMPFNGAPLNLCQTLTKAHINSRMDQKNYDSEMDVRLSKEEYSSLFLHFHYLLLIKGNVNEARAILPRLATALSTLVATTSLTRSSLIQMCTISIFCHSYFSKQISLKPTDEGETLKDEDTFVDPCNREDSVEVLEDLIVAMVASLLLPIYTIKDPEAALAFVGLPAILVLLEWLLVDNHLSSAAVKKRQDIWPGICTLTNHLQKPLAQFDELKYTNVPLPEHWELQCFKPLLKAVSKFRFQSSVPVLKVEECTLLRAHQLTEITKKFCHQSIEGGPLIKVVSDSEESGLRFETQAPPPVEEVLDLERLTLQPIRSEKIIIKTSVNKDKMGILKSRGSIEKVKHKDCVSETHEKKTSFAAKTVLVSDLSEPPKQPKSRANVAMQAILKRQPVADVTQVDPKYNSEQPQNRIVTFQTETPSASPNPSDASTESQKSQLSTPPATPFPVNPDAYNLGGATMYRPPFPGAPPSFAGTRPDRPTGPAMPLRRTQFPNPLDTGVARPPINPLLRGPPPLHVAPPILNAYGQAPSNQLAMGPWGNPPNNTFFPGRVDPSAPYRFEPPSSSIWSKDTFPSNQPGQSGSSQLSQLFSRPPPPIRHAMQAPGLDSYPVPRSLMSASADTVNSYHTETNQDLFRGNSTYSLFGPLGGHEPDSHGISRTVPQLPNHTSQKLWSGPSPLERLLEQKKFATSKSTAKFDSTN